MAKVNEKARQIYYEKIKDYKKQIKDFTEAEAVMRLEINRDEEQGNYKRLRLADEILNVASIYILINQLSVSLLGVKNEESLNQARKACYKVVIFLEEIFSAYIDAPYHDYEDKVKTVEAFPEEERFKLIRKLGFAINTIKDGFGESSKWKWSFVELEARMACQCKNIMDLKKVIAGMDPRVEGYQKRIEHLNRTKELLQEAAEGYRRKYELSTRRMDDFKTAIEYLAAYRRLLVVMGRPGESEETKKKIEVWKTKMDTDMKKAEQSKRPKL